MGWPIEQFPSQPDEELLCGICKGVFRDAVATLCGHTFCSSCLGTWLGRSRPTGCTRTCPQCRSSLGGSGGIPVYSLRQVVNKICVYCVNRDRGCHYISRLEDAATHTEYCGYAERRCEKCHVTFNRKEESKHVDTCHQKSENSKYSGYSKQEGGTAAQRLEKRVENLELELKRAKKKLEVCSTDNRVLRRELRAAKSDIEKLSQQIRSGTCTVSPNLPKTTLQWTAACRESPEHMSELSLLIASSLRMKPTHVCAADVFLQIKRHYEKYARCGTCYEYDVHMLVATAYASNWFSGEQRVLLHHWLESIGRYRKYVNMKTRMAAGLRVSPTQI